MSNFQVKSSFLQGSESITRQSFIIKGLSSSNCNRKLDLKRLLELLNITNDVNLQLKLFSTLSAYLIFNKGANIEAVIKCNAVYDKIQCVLAKGLPRKSVDALNFLSTLLYIDAEDGTTRRKTLAVYASNMTRVSGCLSAMCEMFTDYMLYHDTWKALCQCLAVACSGNEINQSYCSHLIPVCIQKCSQVNIDTLLVLQSLMLNHQRNSQLFLHCNGVKIFTRDILHYDKCMQLLATVVQCPGASTSLQQTNVLEDLRDFLRLYGPNSQLGQRAIIILNHLSIGAKGKETNKRVEASAIPMQVNKSTKETDPEKQALLELNVNQKTESEFEETKVLIQNVMKEVFNWKQSELHKLNKDKAKLDRVTTKNGSGMTSLVNKPKLKRPNMQRNETNTLIETKINEISTLKQSRRNKLQRNIASELSFSFLENDEFKVPTIPKEQVKRSAMFQKTDTQQLTFDDTQLNWPSIQKVIETNKHDKHFTTTLQDFSPIFASTPKHAIETVATVNSFKSPDTHTKQNKYNNLKMKRQKAKKEHQQKNKSMKNLSLGARFFGAINDSCTTFVKTVRNIFNKKESSNGSHTETSFGSDTADNTVVTKKRSKTFSFINYMRKRDAVLNDGWMQINANASELGSLTANSCRTCNDTEVLKQKLTKNEFLKQTVKKLKLGINLYGCDFKKISKTMWPRETYMTSLVLYNLYRKLLK